MTMTEMMTEFLRVRKTSMAQLNSRRTTEQFAALIPDSAADWFTGLFNKKVGIFGDYDCDGTNSAHMAVELLTGLLLCDKESIHVRLASRLRGYGFSMLEAEALLEQGAEAILVLDCGSNSTEALAMLRDKGVPYLVLDHHTISEDNAFSDDGICNPQKELRNRNKQYRRGALDLCTGGLMYALACKMHSPIEVLRRMAAPAMLATVADCTNMLNPYNREIYRRGVDALKKGEHPGLEALVRKTYSKDFTTRTISWQITPAINAAGRMYQEIAAYEMLDSTEKTADKAATTLTSLNRKRRDIQNSMIDELPDCAIYYGDHLFVARGDGWSTGIMGALAGRLSGVTNKLVILINGKGNGSGRVPESIEEGIFDVLKKAHRGLRVAGHTKAFGVDINLEEVFAGPEGLTELKSLFRKLDEKATAHYTALQEHDLEAYDFPVEEWREFKEEILLMEPFGNGFEYPRILVDTVVEKWDNGQTWPSPRLDKALARLEEDAKKERA